MIPLHPITAEDRIADALERIAKAAEEQATYQVLVARTLADMEESLRSIEAQVELIADKEPW